MHSKITFSFLLLTFFSSSLTFADTVTWFAEDFNTGSANWKNENSVSAANLTHVPSGGISNSGYATTDFAFASGSPFGATIFRAQDEFTSSNNDYTGNWLEANIAEVKFSIRHNAPDPISFGFRASLPPNSPGTGSAAGSVVQPNVWTELSFLVENFIGQGPPGTNEAVLSNVGNFQVTATPPYTPGDISTPPDPEYFTSFTYDIDQVVVIANVPEPTSATLACLMVSTCASLGIRRQVEKRNLRSC